jgi:carbon dioxide concentrating mechanism protein CcmM
MNNYSYSQANGSLDANVVNNVRQLLAQGYRVGTEYADERRFQTSSWKSCAPIQSSREGDVLADLQACLSEHSGQYVRLIGIDTKAKKRVLETIIQRPNGKSVQASSNGSGYGKASAPQPSYRPAPASSNGKVSAGGLPGEAVELVRHLLAQGARIGTEHADARRFQTSSWHSCSPIQSNRESEVLAQLEGCMAEHAGEYVRMFGIDSKAKRRLGDLIIQRPNGKVVVSGSGSSGSARSYAAPSSPSPGGYASTSRLAPEVVQQVSQLIAQGFQIGLEYADERRFRTSSWNSSAPVPARRESDAIAALESFLSEHSRDYVRLVGIDPKAKRRVVELIIQRPNGKQGTSTAGQPFTPSSASSRSQNSSQRSSSQNGARATNSVGSAVNDQIRQLLAQSYRIGVEYADERRYRTSSWQTGVLQGSRESDIASSLQSFLNEHQRDYVRLIGIDPRSKRRVVETIIHKPGKATVR